MQNDSTIIANSQPLQEFFEKKILIVDDIELVCQVVAKHLISGGFSETRFETDPRNVLDVVADFLPDLILLDICMPHLSGLELLKLVRADSRFDQIIVLMLSSAGADEQYQSLELGAFGFIQKPVTAVNLVQTITQKFSIARRLGVQ